MFKVICINAGPIPLRLNIPDHLVKLREGNTYTVIEITDAILKDGTHTTGYQLAEAPIPTNGGFDAVRFIPLTDESDEIVEEKVKEAVYA